MVGEVCARLALLYGPFAREGEENVVKLGLVLECDTGGADELVLTCLARRLKPGTSIQAVALGSKAAVSPRGSRRRSSWSRRTSATSGSSCGI